MTNFFPGLARGPIDHDASSVINAISNGSIIMGSAVQLKDLTAIAPVPPEILPRVEEITNALTSNTYGIVVGGDVDGIYGTGVLTTDDINLASNSAGQGVVVVTQGRCLARVESTVAIPVGGQLSASDIGTEAGVLKTAVSTGIVVARALQKVDAAAGFHIIAVDVQREGIKA